VGPGQQHKHVAKDGHDRGDRLVQDEADHIVPEPGREAFDPDTKCLLAGLVDVVPELAKPGKAQGVVGDVPCPVIDHEDKSAGQQQQSHQTEKAADHASPTISRAQIRCQPLAARRGKFNLASTLSGLAGPGRGAGWEAEGVDAVTSDLYKTPQLAAGAIPPPLFF
jgi:hypothetical protein